MAAPFARARAMMAQLAVIATMAVHQQHGARAALGPYISRGKGGRTPPQMHGAAARVKRASIKAANRARNKGAHRGKH